MTTTTLYERLGGAEALRAAIPAFYRRVTADAQLAPYFRDTDMAHQARMLAAFLGQAAGGPQDYHGRSLAFTHAGLGITDEDFTRVVGHLADTLASLGVDPGVIRELGVLAESVRDQVTGGA